MLYEQSIQTVSAPHAILRIEPNADYLRAGIDSLAGDGAQSVMILATAADRWDPAAVQPVVSAASVPVFGGVFPAVFCGDSLHDDGTLLVGLRQPVATRLVSGISGDRDALLNRLEDDPFSEAAYSTVLTFVDSRRSNAEFLVDSLYDIFGDAVVVAGGGVGSLTERFVPGIFSNAGLETDAAILIGFDDRALQTFEHGWATLDGPHLITAAEGTVVHSINHSPAAQVYRDAVERNTDWRFADHDFRKISSLYPLGIEQPSGPHLVRDPLSVDGDSLISVGEVPNGAIVQILQGDKAGLINAAGGVSRALARTRLAERPADPAVAFAWDCASRRKYLLDDFQQELTAIAGALPPQDRLVGAMTLAEIASTGFGTIRLLNKSLVMMYP